LVEQEDYDRALSLYEKSLALTKVEKPGALEVLLSMEIGRLAFIEKKYDLAADRFDVVRQALEDPKKYELSDKVHNALLGNPRVTYSLLAEAFLEAGRLESASDMFEKALADKASQPLLAYHLARIEMANGRPQAAIEQLDKFLVPKQTGAGSEPYALFFDALVKLHGEGEAKEKLRSRLVELQRSDAENAALAHFLAEKYQDWGELDAAAETFEAAVKITPTLQAYQSLIDIYRTQNQPEKLLTILGSAIGQTRSLSSLGKAGEAVAKDERLVAKLLEIAQTRQKAADAKPSADEALAAAFIATKAKQFDAAEELFATCAAADKERKPATLESWGLQMFMAQQYDRAAKVFQQAIAEKVAPRFDADFNYYLAAALEFGGKTDEALKAATRAAELEKGSPRYESRYAWVLYHAKRYADAEREYLRFIAKHDDDHDSEEVRDAVREARMVLSNIYIHLDRMPDAEEYLEQVLDEYPEDVGALNDLGYLWSDQHKHLRRSLKMVQTAVKAEPDNAAYRDSLGWAHYRLGEFDQAIEQLQAAEKALADNPDGVIYDHLGDALHAAGRKQDAEKAWERAIELFTAEKDDENLAKTRAKLERKEE
jgi:tetratricopeptide (TPR) repeat protein